MPTKVHQNVTKLDWFHELAAPEAIRELLTCCASPAWAARLAAGRPYASTAELSRLAAELAEQLSWEQMLPALAAHPRIGERAAGDDREARWSRQEQADASGLDFAAANRDYEHKFGHVYLVCASGRTGPELLNDLKERLGNEAAAERRTVARELGKIAALRLNKLLGQS